MVQNLGFVEVDKIMDDNIRSPKIVLGIMCLGVTCPGVRCPNYNLGVKGPGVTCHGCQVSIEDGALSVSASLVHVIGVRCQSLFYIKCPGIGYPKSIRGRKSGHRCLGVRSTGVKRVPPHFALC